MITDRSVHTHRLSELETRFDGLSDRVDGLQVQTDMDLEYVKEVDDGLERRLDQLDTRLRFLEKRSGGEVGDLLDLACKVASLEELVYTMDNALLKASRLLTDAAEELVGTGQ